MQSIVTQASEGMRLDMYFHEIVQKALDAQVGTNIVFNRSQIAKYLDGVSVNGKKEKKGYKVRENDVLEVDIESVVANIISDIRVKDVLEAEDGDLKIVEESSDWIVLYKPKGVVVHPGVGNWEGTLANRIKGYLISKGDWDSQLDRAGIVHRLDKGVSGLMIVAKNAKTQQLLKSEFENHRVLKVYKARIAKLPGGGPKGRVIAINPSEGTVPDTIATILNTPKYDFSSWFFASGYIGRSRSDRKKMSFDKVQVTGGYKKALSHIKLFGNSECLIKIDSGRMHQIRATLAYLGYYIYGDSLYGPKAGVLNSDFIELESVILGLDLPGVGYKLWSI